MLRKFNPNTDQTGDADFELRMLREENNPCLLTLTFPNVRAWGAAGGDYTRANGNPFTVPSWDIYTTQN